MPESLPGQAPARVAARSPSPWRLTVVAGVMLGLASQAGAATSYALTDLVQLGLNATTLGPGLQVGGTALNGSGAMLYDAASGVFTNISLPVSGAANFIGPSRINASGQVLGSSRVLVAARVQYVYAALRQADGSAVQALVLPTDRSTYGIDINNSGQMLMSNNLAICNPGLASCDFTNQRTYYIPQYLWTAADGAALLPKIGYAGRVTSINSAGQNATTYAVTGLRRNTGYRFRVRATNAAGRSAYSNILDIRTWP